ncbi:hypothetical protein AgCh_032044 [Apium graveolens]
MCALDPVVRAMLCALLGRDLVEKIKDLLGFEGAFSVDAHGRSGGDMNNVTKQEDKQGGRPYPTWLINGFQETLEGCDLYDVELIGYPYTWEHERGTSNWVEVKLDRAIANSEFMEAFTDIKLTNLEISTSDHCPLLFEPKIVSHFVSMKAFRFENAWLHESMCRKIVEEVWTRRKINQINTLQNEAGQSVGWETGLKETMVNYFSSLFAATEKEWNVMFEAVSRRINQAQNDVFVGFRRHKTQRINVNKT